MESIGVVGISVHGNDAADLARFTISRADRAQRLPALAAAIGASELLYLATCNRVEVIYRRPSRAAGRTGVAPRDFPIEHDPRPLIFRSLLGREAHADEAEKTFRVWSGEGAVEHLFLVAAGLDSAQLGEREIQVQIRDALALARAAGTSGVMLDHLVSEALRAARQVHLRTQLGAGRVSFADIAAEHLIERVRRTPSPVALVGVSAMTRRCAEILLRERIPFILVNRTLARAQQVLTELGAGESLSLDEFRQRPPQVEAVLCATGAPDAVLDRAALERLAARTASQEPPLLVDLSIPPDVEPDAARAAQVPRVGMDEINGVALEKRQSRQAEVTAARQVVDQAVQGWRRRLAERALGPVITRINQRYRETALEGVERLLTKQGLVLEGEAREAVERWAETLGRRFAHLPTRGLRGLAAEHGMLAVKSFLASCDGDSFAEFCEEAEQLEELSQLLERELE